MSKNTKNTTSGGIGFAGMLAILFIGLKLGKVIDWSWLWVLSPLWISVGLAVIVIIVCVIMVFIAGGEIK